MNTSVLAGVPDFHPSTNSPNTIRELNYAYGATRAKRLTAPQSLQEPYDAANNAESYALYALARYVVLREGFYPGLPVLKAGEDGAVVLDGHGEEVRFANFGQSDVL